MLKLTVIIVNANTRELTCQSVQSIYDNAPRCRFEIIVVDNASDDGSCEAIQSRFREVKLIRNAANLGFCRANNKGLEVAVGERLLLLNNDTIVLPGSLDALLLAMDEEKSLGIVAPKLVYPDGTLQMSFGPMPNLFVACCTFFDLKRLMPQGIRRAASRSCLSRLTGKAAGGYLSWFSGDAPETRLIDESTYVTAACILIRRECYEQVGCLDPRFFMYVDDADYSKRVHEAGWKILYLAESTIIHIKGGTAGQRYRWTHAPAYQSMLYFMKKHRGTWAFHISKMFAVLALFGRWVGKLASDDAERKRCWTLLSEVASYRVSN